MPADTLPIHTEAWAQLASHMVAPCCLDESITPADPAWQPEELTLGSVQQHAEFDSNNIEFAWVHTGHQRQSGIIGYREASLTSEGDCLCSLYEQTAYWGGAMGNLGPASRYYGQDSSLAPRYSGNPDLQSYVTPYVDGSPVGQISHQLSSTKIYEQTGMMQGDWWNTSPEILNPNGDLYGGVLARINTVESEIIGSVHLSPSEEFEYFYWEDTEFRLSHPIWPSWTVDETITIIKTTGETDFFSLACLTLYQPPDVIPGMLPQFTAMSLIALLSTLGVPAARMPNKLTL